MIDQATKFFSTTVASINNRAQPSPIIGGSGTTSKEIHGQPLLDEAGNPLLDENGNQLFN